MISPVKWNELPGPSSTGRPKLTEINNSGQWHIFTQHTSWDTRAFIACFEIMVSGSRCHFAPFAPHSSQRLGLSSPQIQSPAAVSSDQPPITTAYNYCHVP